MKAADILNKYIKFFEERGHVRIENSSLVPLNDPTTLFTSSGMQPLVPFLLGEKHPQGVRLVNAQNCFRAQDIDEIGDNRHTTFFRMLGNWSLGDYFKKEQLPYFFAFLTDELGLDANKLYVTVFAGNETIPKDTESIEIWKNLFQSKGIKAEVGERIFEYDVAKNWWSRAGTPDKMPVGEPGGPDSEVFYDFETEHNPEFGEKCHVNCDCGRYMEIGNSVFMQYIKTDNGFEELPQKNVDFGGGLERLLAAYEHKQDVFETTLFYPIIEVVKENIFQNKFDYIGDQRITRAYRIIVDHLIGAIFMVNVGVFPSNKERGSVLRRLIRRAITQKFLWGNKNASFDTVIDFIIKTYSETDPLLLENTEKIKETINEEESRANKAIDVAFKVWAKWVEDNPGEGTFGHIVPGQFLLGSGGKMPPLSAEKMFDLFQSYGLSLEIIKEVTHGHVDSEGFERLLKQHQETSRAGAQQKFAGGLADHQELTIKGHTATHLVHQALRDVLGNSLHQTGSNITSERVRFDFTFDRKLTEEELKKVNAIVHEKIQEDLPVHYEIMPLQKAKDLGAIGLFNDKYAQDVKIYFIGDYSKEFCGGPHVEHTGVIHSFDILKEEGVARGVRRIYIKVS